jgi:general secretion pathway protein F
VAVFEYRALSPQGKSKKGVLEGDSERQIRQILREQGLMPTQIHAVNAKKPDKSSSSWFEKKVSVADLSLFSRDGGVFTFGRSDRAT